MELANNPNFLPLATASPHIQKWTCGISTKAYNNVYFKCLEGQGEIELENQGRYKGQIKDGLFEGKGVFYWPTGIVYQGDFKASKITGVGKFLWPDGSFYEGQIHDGKREGAGTFFCASENYTYIGQWQQGLKQGKGKIHYKDQSTYQGQFWDNRRNGYGKMTYSSRNQYEGMWKNDKKDGKGTMNWINAHERYVGEWKEDLQDGYGEYFWCDNKTQFKIFKNTYKGYWKRGKRSGFGSFFYSNGCRFEGYFFENLKEGSGITIDEYGNSKLQQFSNNRPTMLLQAHPSRKASQTPSNKDNEMGQRFPSIGSKSHSKHNSLPQAQPEPTPTTDYKNSLDFAHPELSEPLFNMLLRYNSKLRNLYKCIGVSNPGLKDFYSGMVLENYWKAIRECRLLSQGYSLVALDRDWARGTKFWFEVALPDPKVVEVLKRRAEEGKELAYEDALWQDYFLKLTSKAPLDWSNMNACAKQLQSLVKPTPPIIDIHHPSTIVLFRHFICLIIHTAMLADESSRPLKDKVEALINGLEHFNDPNIRNEKCQDSFTQAGNARAITVPEWVKQVHEELVYEIEEKVKNFDGKLDISVPVRKMYSVLEMGSIFKDVNEKILYLERIQRYLNIKNSPLKKQHRGLYPEIEKCIKWNPSFGYLMNYEMNLKEIHEFLFLCINKKFVASSQEEFQAKYKDIVRMLIKEVREAKKDAHPHRAKLKCRRGESEKDKAKRELILSTQRRKEREVEEEKQKKMREREDKERELMAREDYDAQDIILESGQDSQDYYG